jgi:site-specific DNA-methyltransferase (adenine-specific)
MVERKKKIIEEYGQRYNVWTFKTSKNGQEDEISYQHPAIFPIQLAKDHITSWSNQNELIYDPFMGSGTTAKAAILTGRNFLGSEISEEYFDLSLKRITSVQKELL